MLLLFSMSEAIPLLNQFNLFSEIDLTALTVKSSRRPAAPISGTEHKCKKCT